MFGSHLSIAGGLHKAVVEAQRLGFDTVQVFTKNQQQWRVPPLADDAANRWHDACSTNGFTQTVSHDSYLINLASPDDELRRRSIDLFVEELARCDRLKIPYLVSHPGAHCADRDDAHCEQAALDRVAQSLDECFARMPRSRTVVCLESTAGQGTSLGHRLEHLGQILRDLGRRRRVGICLDTAHLFAAGYDFRGRNYPRFLRELDRTVGIDRVRVWHLNDSKKPLGSRVDRHAHIGQGEIGAEGFRGIVRDKRWRATPKILETPKELDASGQPWDAANLRLLPRLMKR